MTDNTPRAVGGRVAVGASFFLSARLTVRLLAIVNIAVLGRLLSPADFGVMALALIVVGLNEAIQNRQFEYSLIRMERPEKAHFDTALGLALLLGATMAAAIVMAAAPMARLMDAPPLEGALYWLALAPVIDGLRNPYFALFEKELRFAPSAAVEAASRICLTLTAVAMGFLWGNYWAIVAGMLVLSVVRTALTYILAPRRAGVGLARWREFLQFGGWLSGSGVIGFAEARISTAMVGAQFSSLVVGVYHVGSDMVAMATTALAQPFVNAIYPGLVAVAADAGRFRHAYVKAQAMMLALFLPVGAGIALTAPELVLVLIGAKWREAVPILQVLAPVLALATIATPVYAATMVRDRTRAHLEIAAIGLAVQIPALVFGLWAFGLMGAIYARCLSVLVRSAVALRFGALATGGRSVEPVIAAWRSFASAAVMTLVVLALRERLPESEGFVAAAINLAAMASVGGAVYAGSHLALWRMSGAPDGVERVVLGVAANVRARLMRRRA